MFPNNGDRKVRKERDQSLTKGHKDTTNHKPSTEPLLRRSRDLQRQTRREKKDHET